MSQFSCLNPPPSLPLFFAAWSSVCENMKNYELLLEEKIWFSNENGKFWKKNFFCVVKNWLKFGEMKSWVWNFPLKMFVSYTTKYFGGCSNVMSCKKNKFSATILSWVCFATLGLERHLFNPSPPPPPICHDIFCLQPHRVRMWMWQDVVESWESNVELMWQNMLGCARMRQNWARCARMFVVGECVKMKQLFRNWMWQDKAEQARLCQVVPGCARICKCRKITKSHIS